MPRFTKEQQEAIDIEGLNVLVSAGAGSGKTEVLSQRVLRKVLSGVSIDNLLVLTFTNAAAAEMKVRIRDKISAYDNLKSEFDKVEASYITTFDAFTLGIVKKYHYLKDLNKHIDICDASIITLKKNEILDSMFEDLYKNNDEDFLHLIKTYSFKNDDEIKSFVKNAQKEIELFYDKKEFLNNFINNFYSDNKITEFENKYFSLVKECVENVKYAYENLTLIDSDYSKKINFSLLFSANTYEEVHNHFNKDLPRLTKNSSDELKAQKELLSEMLKKLESYLVKPTMVEYKIDYLSTKKCAGIFINLITKFDEKITDFKLKENLFEFLDIEKLAIDILRENESVRLHYKNRFNEILIDEYQDTSDLQEIFTELISSDNVYMVGDIKQSIYRFRNANPDIFREKFNNYGKKIGGKRIDLNKNFRSRNEVLTNINMIFNFLMDDAIGGANYEKEHKLIFGNSVYEEEGKTTHTNDFEILNYEKDEDKVYSSDEIEIFTIAKDILTKVESGYEIYDRKINKNRCATFSDFAVLIDTSKNFDLIKKIFTYKNVPLTIYKDESIKDSINIKIIKNLLKLVSKTHKKEFDKEFSYAYTSIARSYLFSLKDEEILLTIRNKEFFKTEIFQKISVIAKNLFDKNAYDVTREIYEDFDIYNKIIRVGSVFENYAVLEYIINAASSASSLYSIDDFINYLDNITYGDIDIKYSLSLSEETSVKLMTIHRSKGLEYPVVYFPSLAQKFNDRDIKEKFTFNKKLGFILPSSSDGFNSVFTKPILKNEFLTDDISEKLRLFYVALTRAREKFIFVMNFENKNDYELRGVINNYERMKYKSFKNFLESVNKVVLPYQKNVDISSLSLTKDYDASIKSDYKKALPKTSDVLNVCEREVNEQVLNDEHFSKTVTAIFTDNEKENIKKGLILHKIMEEIDFSNPNTNMLDPKYQLIVKNFLNSEILLNAINFYKEYEFMYENENSTLHGIIDLLIEKENEFIIVDYKLSSVESSAYIRQLNGYKNYISSLSKKPVSIYLYSLIKGEFTKL